MPKRKDDGKGFQKGRLAKVSLARAEAREAKQPRIADFWLATAMYLAGIFDRDIYVEQLRVLGSKSHAPRLKKRLESLEQAAEDEVEVEQYNQAAVEKF